jgi:hypothetical protein
MSRVCSYRISSTPCATRDPRLVVVDVAREHVSRHPRVADKPERDPRADRLVERLAAHRLPQLRCGRLDRREPFAVARYPIGGRDDELLREVSELLVALVCDEH